LTSRAVTAFCARGAAALSANACRSPVREPGTNPCSSTARARVNVTTRAHGAASELADDVDTRIHGRLDEPAIARGRACPRRLGLRDRGAELRLGVHQARRVDDRRCLRGLLVTLELASDLLRFRLLLRDDAFFGRRRPSVDQRGTEQGECCNDREPSRPWTHGDLPYGLASAVRMATTAIAR